MTRSGAGGVLCDRTRNWVSLELDAELSEFEHALMKAHLACCEECREFQHEIVGVTTALRGAPLERVDAPVILPAARRFGTARLQVAAAAAAILVAAALGGTLGSLRGGGPAESRASGPSAASRAAAATADPLLRDVKLAFVKPDRTVDLGEGKPPLTVQL